MRLGSEALPARAAPPQRSAPSPLPDIPLERDGADHRHRPDRRRGVLPVHSPDRHRRDGDRPPHLREQSLPRDRPGIRLRRRRMDRPEPDIAGARALRPRASSGVSTDPPRMKPSGTIRLAVSRGRSSSPRWAPSAPAASAMSIQSLTMGMAPVSRVGPRNARASSRISRVEPPFQRTWIVRAPPRSAASAASTGPSEAAGSVITVSASRSRREAAAITGSRSREATPPAVAPPPRAGQRPVARCCVRAGCA